MKIISGKDLSDRLKAEMAADVATYQEKYGRLPKLSVVLVGNDPGSVSYVTGKAKACDSVGILNETIVLEDTITEEALLAEVHRLNKDQSVDGILIQLPLPKHINEATIVGAVCKEKDVDGFHPLNVAGLWSNTEAIIPCTPKGVIKLIKSENIEIRGKRAVVIGRSNIVGLPVAKLLLNENATVTICHSKTENLAEVCAEADILIAAIGRAKFVKPNFIKQGAVVIDVGVNRDEETGKLCGDVDFEACKDKTSYITKVPGGVGPMTITCLIENTIEQFLKTMSK